MLRTLILLLLLIIVLVSRPWFRSWLLSNYGERNWRTFKINLVIVVILYFLVSLVISLFKYKLL